MSDLAEQNATINGHYEEKDSGLNSAASSRPNTGSGSTRPPLPNEQTEIRGNESILTENDLPPPNDSSTPVKNDRPYSHEHREPDEETIIAQAIRQFNDEFGEDGQHETVENELALIYSNQRLLVIERDLQMKCQSNCQKINELNEQMEALMRRLEIAENDREDLLRKCQQQKDSHDQIVGRLQKQVDASKQFTEEQLTDHEQERDRLLTEIESLRADLSFMRKMPADSTCNNETSAVQKYTFDIAVDTDKLSAKVYDEYGKKRKESLDDLKDTVCKEQELRKDVEECLRRKSEQMEQFMQKALEEEEKLLEKSRENAHLVLEIDKLNIESAELVIKNKDLEDEKSALLAQVQAKMKHNNVLKEHIVRLESAASARNQQKRDMDALQLSLSQSETVLKRKDDHINELCARLRSSKAEIDRYKTEADHLRSSVSQVKTTSENYQIVLAENKQLREEIAKMVSQVEAVKDVQKAFESSEANVSKLEKTVKDLEQTLDVTLGEKEELTKERLTLEEGIRQWQAHCSKLQDDSVCFKENAERQYEDEMSHFQCIVAQKEAQIVALEVQLNRVHTEARASSSSCHKTTQSDDVTLTAGTCLEGGQCKAAYDRLLAERDARQKEWEDNLDDMKSRLRTTEDSLREHKEMMSKVESERNSECQKLADALCRLKEEEAKTSQLCEEKEQIEQVRIVHSSLAAAATDTFRSLTTELTEERKRSDRLTKENGELNGLIEELRRERVGCRSEEADLRTIIDRQVSRLNIQLRQRNTQVEKLRKNVSEYERTERETKDGLRRILELAVVVADQNGAAQIRAVIGRLLTRPR